MYRIYNDGKVYSEYTQKFVRHFDDGHGYYQVSLYTSKYKKVTTKVHILVAKAFLDNPKGLTEVNHKDCDKHNNTISNLEWTTHQENMIHAGKHLYNKRETLSPLTKEMVCLIPELLKDGMSIKLIASLYKVGHITIRKIIQGKRWKHLNLTFGKWQYKKGIVEVSRDVYNKLMEFNVDNTVLNSRVKILESM